MKAKPIQIIEKYEIIFIGLLILFCIICIQYSTLNFIQKGTLTALAGTAFLSSAYAIEKQKKARKNEVE